MEHDHLKGRYWIVHCDLSRWQLRFNAPVENILTLQCSNYLSALPRRHQNIAGLAHSDWQHTGKFGSLFACK